MKKDLKENALLSLKLMKNLKYREAKTQMTFFTGMQFDDNSEKRNLSQWIEII